MIEAIEGIRVAVGPGILLQYCLQGMFHPARRVREVYWKIYNNVYIGAQDGLIAYYPRVEDDGRNNYSRRELDLIV